MRIWKWSGKWKTKRGGSGKIPSGMADIFIVFSDLKHRHLRTHREDLPQEKEVWGEHDEQGPGIMVSSAQKKAQSIEDIIKLNVAKVGNLADDLVWQSD